MPSRRGFHPVRNRSRRLMSWGVGPGSQVLTQLTASGSSILGSGAVLATEDRSTVIRIRGYFQAYLSLITTLNDGYHAALGIGIASGDAFGIGQTALPNPLDDVDWPGWMYHRFFDVHGVTAGEADGINAGIATTGFEVDTKAMRKWGSNEVLFASVQVVEAGTATINMFFDTRILLKLS